MFNVLNKPLSKMNIDDMGKAVEKLAQKDKKLAMALYGENPVEYIRSGDVAHEFFERNGRMTQNARQSVITDLQDKFQLSAKEAQKEFNRMTIGDFLTLFTQKFCGSATRKASTGDVFEKPLAKITPDDMAEIINQTAIKDKSVAMKIYGRNIKEVMSRDVASSDTFLPSGRLHPKAKEHFIKEIISAEGLTKAQAEQKYATAKIGEFLKEM